MTTKEIRNKQFEIVKMLKKLRGEEVDTAISQYQTCEYKEYHDGDDVLGFMKQIEYLDKEYSKLFELLDDIATEAVNARAKFEATKNFMNKEDNE